MILPNLSLNERYRGCCPSCGRNTFSCVRSNNKILYNCFSASCSVSGSRPVEYTVEDAKARQRASEGVLETNQDVGFSISSIIRNLRYDSRLSSFLKPYGLNTDGWRFDPKEQRAVYLIQDETGQVVDAIGRSLVNRLPKWKRYGDNTAPVILRGASRDLVIVEDILSAIRLRNIYNDFNVLALLGTSISFSAVSHLSSFKNGFIALDKDATDKAIQMHRRIAPFFDRCRVIMLHSDIKDSDDVVIRGLFENDRTYKGAMR